MEGLLARYALSLMNKGRRLEAVELYRRANRPTDSALLIGDIAEQVARKEVQPALAKRLHVLSALEIERHRKVGICLHHVISLNCYDLFPLSLFLTVSPENT